ncbi:hypothetical protein NF867_12900 [Solitalea sp. MAHUQ-68]|uniref:TonB-dependent receptor plug domain-containing protein n=1 Tax=Solitalea agri TaxID=2953739 RepID=A0A9X2F8N2_9SPHI|nr:hypothetical protein [Solitalea agri]MCO4293763.1 hypothetical protein [Solitalea agri]
MKYILLLSICLLSLVFKTNAQQVDDSLDIANIDEAFWNKQLIVTIKGEELNLFPSYSLMEMLIGRVPGYDVNKQVIQDFLFIVDGVVNPYVNSINVNDIEEINYYHGGLEAVNGAFRSKGGVFFIKTKKHNYAESLTVDFVAQIGNINNQYLVPNHKSYLTQSYTIGLHQGTSKFKYAIGANYLKNYNGGSLNKDYIVKSNITLDYHPINFLETGIAVNYSPAASSYTVKEDFINLNRTQESELELFTGNFYLNVKPTRNLINQFSITRLNDNYEYNLRRENEQDDFGSQLSIHRPYLLIQNTLSYSKKFKKIDFGSLLNYSRSIRQYKDNVLYFDEGNATGYNQMELGESFNSFAAALFINYNSLSFTGGYRIDVSNDKTFKSPYGSVVYDIKNQVLKNNKFINSLNIYLAYSRYDQSNYPFVIKSDNDNFPDFSNRQIPSSNVFNIGSKFSIYKNRFNFSADYSTSSTQETVMLDLPATYDSQKVKALIDLKTKGWRFCSATKVIDNASVKWDAGFNFSYLKEKLNVESLLLTPSIFKITYGSIYGNQFYQREYGKKTYRNYYDDFEGNFSGGFQNKIKYKQFSFDINTSISLNRKIFVRPGIQREILTDGATFWHLPDGYDFSKDHFTRVNDISINYLALGYTLNKSTLKVINNMGLYLIAKNAIGFDTYDNPNEPEKYYGVAMKITL